MNRTIKVDMLARVEGEGSLYVKIEGNRVADVKFKIFEPPRFFEAFLRGRMYSEAPDITARICGICPVAYQMSSVHAMERALGIQVDAPVRALRRLLYCGEWIESHALHIYLLHAPDFLGFEDALEMSERHLDLVARGLALKKVGNRLMTVIGGREIHPVSVCVGGFYRVPAKRELREELDGLRRARDLALETVEWTRRLEFPDFQQDYEFVSLSHPDEYPLNEGRVISSRGLNIPAEEYEEHFAEQHVAHSNALHSVIRERGEYLVGPLARYNLNFQALPEPLRQLAREAGLEPPVHNPFLGIVVRAVETVWACEEAIRLIEEYAPPPSPRIEPRARAGRGCAVTEAPRGILYHRYELDSSGRILSAKIVPPTSQNQKQIEDDLRKVVERNLAASSEELTWRCEQTVRNYDPCISCATHFLKLTVDRGG